MYKKILVMFLLIGLTGCSSIELKKEATMVRVSNDAAPANCRFVGQVMGFHDDSDENHVMVGNAMIDIRNKAAQLNGNYVRLIMNTQSAQPYDADETESYGLIGNAFYCPVEDFRDGKLNNLSSPN